jgi:hypothetical protein
MYPISEPNRPPNRLFVCAWLFHVYFLTAAGCGPARASNGAQLERQHRICSLRELERIEIGEVSHGEPIMEVILSGRRVNDASMEMVAELPELGKLELRDVRVTDRGIKRISNLTRLTRLVLDGAQLTDDGLSSITNMKSLESLSLFDTRVTYRGLRALDGLSNLHTLELYDHTIDDRSLVSLEGLSQLNQLWLGNASITKAGVERFKRARPGVLQKGLYCSVDREREEITLERRRFLRQGFTGRLRFALQSVVWPN